MAVNLAHLEGKGLSPQQFIQSMSKNQENYNSNYEGFNWPSEEDQEFFESLRFRDDLRCYILSADWCGDVIRNVPAVLKILEATEMPVEILVMEDHLDVMDQFLTMGGRAIPIVIFTDTGGHVLCQWGPRPAHVQEVMTKFKQDNPDREAPDYQDNIAVARKLMAERYGEGLDYQSYIVAELRELLSAV